MKNTDSDYSTLQKIRIRIIDFQRGRIFVLVFPIPFFSFFFLSNIADKNISSLNVFLCLCLVLHNEANFKIRIKIRGAHLSGSETVSGPTISTSGVDTILVKNGSE